MTILNIITSWQATSRGENASFPWCFACCSWGLLFCTTTKYDWTVYKYCTGSTGAVQAACNGPSMSASTRQILHVDSICGPPAAIICSYLDTGVRCSSLGLFVVGWPFLLTLLQTSRAVWISCPLLTDVPVFLWIQRRLKSYRLLSLTICLLSPSQSMAIPFQMLRSIGTNINRLHCQSFYAP